MAAPKLFLGFGEFLESLTAGNTFQNSIHSRNRIPRWKGNQYVNMILRYFPTVYLKIKMAGHLQKKPFCPWANFINKDLFPILWTPYQMVLGFTNRMACSFQAQAVILLGTHPFLKPCGKNPTKY